MAEAERAEPEETDPGLCEETWAEPEPEAPSYSQGYLDGMADGARSRERLEQLRRAGRRRAARLAVAGAIAWVLGAAAADTVRQLARWVES